VDDLLDNGIGALGESGTITVRTSADDGCAVIEVTDDGSIAVSSEPGNTTFRVRLPLTPQ
jgi:signal transduction histidine kinase